jgi:hypothetical protein
MAAIWSMVVLVVTILGCGGTGDGAVFGPGGAAQLKAGGGEGGATSSSTTATASAASTSTTASTGSSGLACGPYPHKACGDGCVDTSSDPQNCGFCGNTCAPPNHGTTACVNSACTIVSCDAGFADCDGYGFNGCEAALDTPLNCGSCGNACQGIASVLPICMGGACALDCPSPWIDCDGIVATGCESMLADDANCGACGKACTGLSHCKHNWAHDGAYECM